MRIHRTLASWRAVRASPEYQGKTVGFVPTMGALHEGHRSLVDRARSESERVVVSIFVNPAQFNDQSDLERYPRTLEADCALVAGTVDDVIAPEAAELYPDGYRFRVIENAVSRELEGAHRPGHFEGVLTVVLKLLNLVQPDRSYFGEKDWQQLQLVRAMAAALFLPGEIVTCPTIRDPDGVAMSSRNRRLSPEGRRRATAFPSVLRSSGNSQIAAAALTDAGFGVDYVVDRDGRRLGAVRIEGVRLIDNVAL